MPYMSKIANAILQTPFDNKSTSTLGMLKALTPDTFFKNCYIAPKFRRIKNFKFQEEDFVIDSGNSAFMLSYQDFLDMIDRQRGDYQNFLQWLYNYDMRDTNNCKVYTISGNAGTGKTTLINYLKFYCEEVEWIVLDCSRATQYISWSGSAKTNVHEFKFAFGKILAIVTDAIHDRLFNFVSGNSLSETDSICNNMKSIISSYTFHHKGNPLMWKCDFLSQIDKILTSNSDSMSCVEQVADYCAKYFEHISCAANYVDALEVLLYVVRCENDGFDKKYAIVFDNIERFIKQDEIFNEDANKIRLNLASYSSNINNAYNRMSHPHTGHFKFLMAVRTSTARMINVKQHSADGGANDMNIDEWYDSDEVIGKRMKWYENESKEDSSEFFNECELVKQIIGDYRKTKDGSVTGLKPQIDALFNNNKRLILEYIGMIVESRRNSSVIQKYKKLWAEDTPESRFAARSIIWGLILYSLERDSLAKGNQDQLFMHLHTYSQDATKSGLGDARKILTILFNNPSDEMDAGMKLSKVLSELFHCANVEEQWNSKDDDNVKKVETLSEVLFYMNSYNRRDNNWIQFIDIQMRRKSKESINVSDRESLQKLISEHMNRIDIHIMPAGEAYLTHIAASFEFFAMRYCEDYAPLFSMIPEPSEMQNLSNVRHLPCYMIIEETVTCARKCLEILRSHGDIPLRIRKNSPMTHATRIKQQHQSYLGAFQYYLQTRYVDVANSRGEYEIAQKYKMLIKEIEKLRKLYN